MPESTCWGNTTPGTHGIEFPSRGHYAAGPTSSTATQPTLPGPSQGPQRAPNSPAGGAPQPRRVRSPAYAEHPLAAGPNSFRAPHRDRSSAANDTGPVTPVATDDVRTDPSAADHLKSILTLNRIQPRSKPAAGRGYFQHIAQQLGHT